MPVQTLFSNISPQSLELSSINTQAVGLISQGFGENKQAQINAKIYEAQARNIEAQGQILSNQYRTKANQLQGTAVTTAARGGLKISGSVASSISQSMEQLALDESYEQYNLSVQKQQALDNARLQRYKGRQAIMNGFYNAGATALKSGADYYNKYYKNSKSNASQGTMSGGFDTSNNAVVNPTYIA